METLELSEIEARILVRVFTAGSQDRSFLSHAPLPAHSLTGKIHALAAEIVHD